MFLLFFYSSKERYQLRGVCLEDFDTQYTIVNKTHLVGNMNSLMIYKDEQWNIVDKTDIRGVKNNRIYLSKIIIFTC